jgi:hypothetical protein
MKVYRVRLTKSHGIYDHTENVETFESYEKANETYLYLASHLDAREDIQLEVFELLASACGPSKKEPGAVK